MKYLRLFENFENYEVGDYIIVNAPKINLVNEPCEIVGYMGYNVPGDNMVEVKPLIKNLGIKLVTKDEIVKKIEREELDLYIQSNKYYILIIYITYLLG